MAASVTTKNRTVQEDIVFDHDGIYEDRYDPRDQFTVNQRPQDSYGDINDIVTDFWPIDRNLTREQKSSVSGTESHSITDTRRRTLQ